MSLMRNDSLLYRFGFVCVAASEPPSGAPWQQLRSEWTTTRIGDLLILTHPEVPVELISESALLIGHAFAVGEDRSVRNLLEAAMAAGPDSVLHETLDVLSGRFALITSRSGGRVYHDAVGSRTVFYRLGHPLCVASHSGLIAELFGDTVDPLAEAIRREPEYANRNVTYLPGDLSIHDGVRALVPNNLYDISSGRTVRYWPRATRQKTTLDQFRSCADTYFSNFAAFLSGRLTPVLGVTPGIDSRTIIAAFRYHNLPMKYVTWKNHALPEQDLPIAERMGSYLGGQHSFLPEKGQKNSEASYRISDLAGENHGHFSGRVYFPAYMYQTFRGQSDLTFIWGTGASIIRGFYNLHRRPIEAASVVELVRVYNSGLKIKPPSEQYIKLVSEAVEQFMLRANYERLEAFGYDLNDLYFWESRAGARGSSIQNSLDTAMLSITGFNSRRLFKSAFGLEPSERLTENILLDLTRRYDEGLATFPINPYVKKSKLSKARQNANASAPNRQLQEKLKAQRERSKSLKKRLEKRESELDQIREQHRETIRQRDRFKHLYLAIRQSRSWRYTETLRRVASALKRNLSG